MKPTKTLLLIQSLSPIALLMLLKIFPYSIFEKTNNETFPSYCHSNLCFSFLLLVFALWLVVAFFSWLYICSLKKIEYEIKNRTINNLVEDKESSLNFFMTFLLPLVIDNVTEINGFLVFSVSFIGVVFLLAKTTLFYKNPVLTLLGYRIFTFQLEGIEKIGICTKNNDNGRMKINYTEISKDVVFFEKL